MESLNLLQQISSYMYLDAEIKVKKKDTKHWFGYSQLLLK